MLAILFIKKITVHIAKEQSASELLAVKSHNLLETTVAALRTTN